MLGDLFETVQHLYTWTSTASGSQISMETDTKASEREAFGIEGLGSGVQKLRVSQKEGNLGDATGVLLGS